MACYCWAITYSVMAYGRLHVSFRRGEAVPLHRPLRAISYVQCTTVMQRIQEATYVILAKNADGDLQNSISFFQLAACIVHAEIETEKLPRLANSMLKFFTKIDLTYFLESTSKELACVGNTENIRQLVLPTYQ